MYKVAFTGFCRALNLLFRKKGCEKHSDVVNVCFVTDSHTTSKNSARVLHLDFFSLPPIDIQFTTSIDRTLHQFLTVTDLNLITEFDFLPNYARFQ